MGSIARHRGREREQDAGVLLAEVVTIDVIIDVTIDVTIDVIIDVTSCHHCLRPMVSSIATQARVKAYGDNK